MSAVTQQKKLISGLLQKYGAKIALNLKKKEQLKQARLYPWAAIISDTARFEEAEQRESMLAEGLERSYKQVRCSVVQPYIVQIYDQDEASCTELMENFLVNLPWRWEYGGLQGAIDPLRCEYSDYYSVVAGSYESALLLEFRIDMGPAAQKGKKITEIGID